MRNGDKIHGTNESSMVRIVRGTKSPPFLDTPSKLSDLVSPTDPTDHHR